jgi:nicotinamidase-related amidase
MPFVLDKGRKVRVERIGGGGRLSETIANVVGVHIRTEQCCETTTRHASDSGYEVDYVTEATLTFAMTDRNGRVWAPEEIKARTELVLDGRFARIATVEEALAGRVDEVAA